MSLFGEDDGGFEGSKPANPRTTARSLFDDEPAAGTQSSSLFADDGDAAAGGSPWGMPTPKRASRGDMVRNLLPDSEVPESYIDAFDALLDGGHREGSNVSGDGVQKLLQGSNLAAAEQTRLLTLVGGANNSALRRSEFNVLLALIGLAQEGDEATLDGVDERRKKLPIPTLTYLDQLKAHKTAAPFAQPQSTSTKQTPLTPTKPRTARQDSLTSDPWASPTATKAPALETAPPRNMPSRERPAAATARTTSTFTTNDASPDDPLPKAGGDSAPADGVWGAVDTTAGFGGGMAQTGFGEEPTNPLAPLGRPIGGRSAGKGAEENVTISLMPEKEGMFMFQHRNYEVKSLRRGSSVVRRYSDFVWLLDCLHKRYPFRQLPLLPPKTLALNGRHLSADNAFIEKRRRGLVRFINALVRHPVLREEQLVIMFLTVPTELSVWRKQATISVQEEFVGKTLPAELEESLPTNLQDTFDTVRDGVAHSAEDYITMCGLMERLAKRKRGLAADSLRFSQTLRSISDESNATYAVDTNDVPLLNEGIRSTAKHLETSHSLQEDESRAWDEGVLEDFKRQRDCLVSMRDLFDRRDRLARNNIPQLEKRIEANETKLQGISERPEGTAKPGEMEKVEQAIIADKQSIVQQHARGVFIKECIRDELQYFQLSQYHVSRLHQDWSQERVKYAELEADNWRALSEEVENMPLGD